MYIRINGTVTLFGLCRLLAFSFSFCINFSSKGFFKSQCNQIHDKDKDGDKYTGRLFEPKSSAQKERVDP